MKIAVPTKEGRVDDHFGHQVLPLPDMYGKNVSAFGFILQY